MLFAPMCAHAVCHFYHTPLRACVLFLLTLRLVCVGLCVPFSFCDAVAGYGFAQVLMP